MAYILLCFVSGYYILLRFRAARCGGLINRSPVYSTDLSRPPARQPNDRISIKSQTENLPNGEFSSDKMLHWYNFCLLLENENEKNCVPI